MVTRKEFEDLQARQVALEGIVKGLVGAEYQRNAAGIEQWIVAQHEAAAATKDPWSKKVYGQLLKIIETMISTPRDPELPR